MRFNSLFSPTRRRPICSASGRSRLCAVLIASAAIACGSGAAAQPETAAATDAGPALASSDVDVNGTTLHVVHAGQGPAVMLLHGFPQDSTVYRRIAPRLAERFSVVVPDLRGIRASASASS